MWVLKVTLRVPGVPGVRDREPHGASQGSEPTSQFIVASSKMTSIERVLL